VIENFQNHFILVFNFSISLFGASKKNGRNFNSTLKAFLPSAILFWGEFSPLGETPQGQRASYSGFVWKK